MIIFNIFPDDMVCPICKTARQEKCVLIPIEETGKFDAFHINCIDLKYYPDKRIIAMRF